MYRIHSTTLCPEDPLRDMLGRIPGCTTYLGHVFSVSSCLEDVEGSLREEQVIPCNYYTIFWTIIIIGTHEYMIHVYYELVHSRY